jgi:hypothetical protein
MTKMMRTRSSIVILVLLLAACGGSDGSLETAVVADVTEVLSDSNAQTTAVPTTAPVLDTEPAAAPAVEAAAAETQAAEPTAESVVAAPTGETETFMVEVWADNWMAFHVNGELVAEDSVSITTERSFNAEVFTFEAVRPFTIAIEAKDFKETDSGIEYIGAGNQQMGDGGIIAQVTNADTGEVVAVTNGSWSTLVVHRAPLNTSCEKDPDPDSTCEFEITATPAGWAAAGFDDSSWATATEWSKAAVSPKDGYNEISWDAAAQLVWGTDLEVDNTVLLRWTVNPS